MDDDMMTLFMFAGVLDLLEKQEIGRSSAGRALQTWMLCRQPRPWIPALTFATTVYSCNATVLNLIVIRGSPPAARMTALRGG
jgi:hypothetical protein